jgi:hypothetical protein
VRRRHCCPGYTLAMHQVCVPPPTVGA